VSRELLGAILFSMLIHVGLARLPWPGRPAALPESKPPLKISLSWERPPSAPETPLSRPEPKGRKGPPPGAAPTRISPHRRPSPPTKPAKTVLERRPRRVRRSSKHERPRKPTPVRAGAVFREISPPPSVVHPWNGGMPASISSSSKGSGTLPPQRVPEGKGEADLLGMKGPPHEAPALPLIRAVPRYDVNPPPRYPPSARRRGYQGVVLLRVRVLEDGTVGEVRVVRSSGYAVLDRAALEAVKQWRFVPARRGDRPIPMEVRVPIRFSLK